MYHIQEIIQKTKKAIRRRRKLLIVIPIFFVGLSIAALYVIEPTYESSTSFLVEQEEDTENLINLYNNNSSGQPQNQLQAIEQIVLSRSAMEMLIDSLGMRDTLETITQKQRVIQGMRQSVELEADQRSSTFEIVVTSGDPVQARDMARLLANYFIDTRSRLENQRTSETVEFLEAKLQEMTSLARQQKEDLVNQRSSQMESVAEDSETLQRSLENTNENMQEVDLQIHRVENRLSIIDNFLNQDPNDVSIQPLHRLSLEEVPNGDELRELLSQYDTLNQQYTEDYPQLRNTKNQILEITKRIRPAVENNLSELQSQRADLEEERGNTMNDLETSYIASEQNNSDRSTYSIYEELTASIKKKLEQARMNQQMDNQASRHFEVLDQPYVAEEPVSPNKQLIVGAGFGLGIFISCLLVAFAEMLDTTIRTEQNLKFKKPVIAYIKDGK